MALPPLGTKKRMALSNHRSVDSDLPFNLSWNLMITRFRRTYTCLSVVLVVSSGLGSLRASGPVVILDAGHGGRDNGATYGGMIEKQLNLDLCLAVEFHLHRMGIDTALTRAGNATLSPAARATYAKYFPHPIFVSLHHNSAQHPRAQGIETYCANATSWHLAVQIQDTLVRHTGATNRGVKSGSHLQVVGRNSGPEAVLVEVGFLSNPQERWRMAQRGYRYLQARAIAVGIANHIAWRGQRQPGLWPWPRRTPRHPPNPQYLAWYGRALPPRNR
jgi:N-acetylmuramoyl-L-alanine amidase